MRLNFEAEGLFLWAIKKYKIGMAAMNRVIKILSHVGTEMNESSSSMRDWAILLPAWSFGTQFGPEQESIIRGLPSANNG
mmetsp:Transcript_32437/g.70026  ORF Transcript_32437/g.70026 Transcript_32437/m.70026 type:complete len:80 (+) Transcript_32437:610-849(+)